MAGPEINLIVLRCADTESTRRFYEGLGLAFVDEKHGSGPAHLSATTPSGVVIELYPASADRDPMAGTSGVRLGFVVSNLDSVVAAAVAHGVTLASRDDERAVLLDPDGRKVEVTASAG